MDRARFNFKVLFKLFIAALVITVSACDSNVTDPSDNLPVDHTVRQGSAFHKPGFETPLAESSNCTSCHGPNLTGGAAVVDGVAVPTPSCFTCHGKKWN